MATTASPPIPFPRRPEIRQFFPVWWHHHGSKIPSRPTAVTENSLTWQASAAYLTLTWVECEPTQPHSPEFPLRHYCWWLEYQIIWGGCERVKAVIRPCTETLRVMFGLQRHFTDRFDIILANQIIQQYGGTTAKQGRFIRWDSDTQPGVSHVNIPHPGFGHDGDPNLSVAVDDEMRQVVAKFIASHPHAD